MENRSSKRSKTRIRRKNNGIRKLIFFAILLFITVFVFIKVLVPGSITFARYVHNTIRTFYLNSKEFYFNSDKLSINTATFESSNWRGTREYQVTINMSSMKNMNEHSKTDIVYDIEYEYEVHKANGGTYPQDSIEFKLKDSNEQIIDLENTPIQRTIFMTSNYSDVFYFSVLPKPSVTFKNKDFILVKIKAKSVRPYVTELTGEFKIIVGTQDVIYKIEDEEYSPYAELIITNEFESYTSLDGTTHLSIDEYRNLSPAEKANYYSKKIKLDFDPTEVMLDTTSSEYIEALSSSDSTDLGYTTITKTYIDEDTGQQVTNTTNYVSHIAFYIDAEESKVIKFYKADAEQNYTYEADDDYLVVTVTYT